MTSSWIVEFVQNQVLESICGTDTKSIPKIENVTTDGVSRIKLGRSHLGFHRNHPRISLVFVFDFCNPLRHRWAGKQSKKPWVSSIMAGRQERASATTFSLPCLYSIENEKPRSCVKKYCWSNNWIDWARRFFKLRWSMRMTNVDPSK